MLNVLQEHKARGAFFTPPTMAEYIVHWAVRTPADLVLEPSCGEAAFLVPTVRELEALGATREAIGQQLHGAELHRPSAIEASRLVAEETSVCMVDSIRIGDFFEARAGHDLPSVDACVGNPPYIRYQAFSGEARRRGREAALAQGVAVDGLASSWAPFTVHAASFVKPGGRLGLVLPAELLSVNYAAPVRRFLLDRFGSVRVILFEERVFPGVLEEVVLLLAEGEGPCREFDLLQVADLDHLPELDALEWSTSPHHGKWTDLLLSPEVGPALQVVEGTDAFIELADVATVSVGMVTGANKYFCLSDEEAKSAGLTKRELLPLVPPGSRHLRGLTLNEDNRRVTVDAEKPVWLFYPSEKPSSAAKKRIQEGQLAGVHHAYKCRVRSPWYRVPLVDPPDFFMTYMTAGMPRLIHNEVGLRYVNSVHGVYMKKRGMLDTALFSLACMSSMTGLSAELVGRAYGGGLLKLEPREALRLAVPSAMTVSRARHKLSAFLPTAHRLLEANDAEGVIAQVDELLLVQTLGLSREVVSALQNGRKQLQGRRARRSRS